MEYLSLPMEPILQPSPLRKALLSLGLGGAGAVILALVALLVPTAQYGASWVVGLILSILLYAIWVWASWLSDAAYFAAGVVASCGGSLLSMGGCALLARFAPGAVGLGCSVNYLRGGIFANVLGIFVCTWLFGWGPVRWYTWRRNRRLKKARAYMEQFGSKGDAAE